MSGVIHAGTGNKKIQINPDSPNRDIAQAINSSNAEYPESPSTYIGQLNSVFEEDLFPTRALSTDLLWLPTEEENTNVGDSIPTPLLERERPPFGASSPNDWEAYNLWHFSPYSNTGGENSRGWAVVQIHGPAFCRPEYDKRIRVPCYFYYALSGNDEFTKEGECAPLAPGKDGYRKLVKLDVDVGDHLVVIGGRNRKSKILVIPEEDTFAAVPLAEHDREGARDYLEAQGYDVGSPGLQESSYSSRSSLQSPTSTEAGRLQRKAETDDIHLLSHLEHLKVACRLLQIDGYNPTRNWFERQYGPDFNPTETDRQLRHIANTYDNLPNPPAR